MSLTELYEPYKALRALQGPMSTTEPYELYRALSPTEPNELYIALWDFRSFIGFTEL